MTYLGELDFGDEIRGVVCPKCGGSLVWRKSRAFCYDHGVVTPEKELVSETVYWDE